VRQDTVRGELVFVAFKEYHGAAGRMLNVGFVSLAERKPDNEHYG
jgi:hypothetical protein